MANLVWLPINPTLTEAGAFSAFAGDENEQELAPIPLAPSDDPFSLFSVMQNSCNIQIAANMGVSVGSISGNYNSFVLFYEAMVYTEKTSTTPIGGKIYGTRWGAGLRVILKITELKSNLNFNFGSIAASSELGLANVEFQITGIGINSPQILAELPGPGDFKFATYNQILSSVEKIKNYMAENTSSLQARPFQVFISDDKMTDVFIDSRAILFATRQIASRNSLNSAITNAKNKYNIATIKATYAKFSILDDRIEPTREQKRAAEEFLSV
jgi:hypothetical protein